MSDKYCVCIFESIKITCIHNMSHTVSYNSLVNTDALIYTSCSTANQPVLLQVD